MEEILGSWHQFGHLVLIWTPKLKSDEETRAGRGLELPKGGTAEESRYEHRRGDSGTGKSSGKGTTLLVDLGQG